MLLVSTPRSQVFSIIGLVLAASSSAPSPAARLPSIFLASNAFNLKQVSEAHDRGDAEHAQAESGGQV